MYNWRLLLLAFFAVFQPIASFIERNLVDGRELCCGDDRFSRDSAYSIYTDNRYKSETRHINDRSRNLRGIRDGLQNGNIRASYPAIDIFQDSNRERETQKTLELRTRLSRRELQRFEIHNGFIKSEQQVKRSRVASTTTRSNRIKRTENRHDNGLRSIRTDDSRLFHTRFANGHVDQRNLERRTIGSEREPRLMHDNVDNLPRIRHARDVLKRNGQNIIRTDTRRVLDNQRIREEPFGRRASATRNVLRNKRSDRSLDRLSRGSIEDRRLFFENSRDAKQKSENHEEVSNETARRNMNILVRERSERDREFGFLFSVTRQVVSRDQRIIRSVDRLSFDNIRIARQEHVNRDIQTRARDDIRTEAGRRNIETPVKQRPKLDRKIGFRFSIPSQFDLRNPRNIELSRQSNDDRRKALDNVRRIARPEHENRDVRSREIDDITTEAIRRYIEKPTKERSQLIREIRSHFLATRQVVLRNQRNVRSLDRISMGSNEDRKLSSEEFPNVRIVKQERYNHDVRVREQDGVKIAAERRIIEVSVRERSKVDQEISTRISSARPALLRNQRNVGSLDRLSMRRNDNRFAIENVRIYKEHKSRDMRERGRDHVRAEAERRNIEMTTTNDREIGSRCSMSRQADNNRERRLSRDSTQRNNKFRISSNFGDHVYQINRQHVLERNDYKRPSSKFRFMARSRIDATTIKSEERAPNQMRDISEDLGNNYQEDIRDVSINSRRTRGMIARRLSRSEPRFSENGGTHHYHNSREKKINEYRLIDNDRFIETRQNQRIQLREISRNIAQRENALRTHRTSREEREQRVENRSSRGGTAEDLSIRRGISSEQRNAHEAHRRVTRNVKFSDNESRFRATYDTRMSSSTIERAIPQTRGAMSGVERRNTRNINERGDSIRNILVTKTAERQNSDSRTKSNVDYTRNYKNTLGQKLVENENKPYENNWQNLIYTMQGIYLCSIFIPLLMNKNSGKNKEKILGLWTSFQKPIKID